MNVTVKYAKGSRPLSGNLFSLQKGQFLKTRNRVWFSSPIGESIFSTSFMLIRQKILYISSRPLSGNLFSLRETGRKERQ